MAIITKIEPQKNKQQRVNIHLDGEYYCAMQNLTCVKYGLKEGLNISKEKLQDMVLESDKEKALNKVANLLSRGLKTEKQIVEYLLKKGYDQITTNFVLNKLTEYNYINDQLYVKSFVSQNSKKFGKRKLAFDLKNKGLKQADIDNALNEFVADEEVLLTLAQKFLKNKEINAANLQKLAQHLSYKGFSWDEINSTIKRLKEL